MEIKAVVKPCHHFLTINNLLQNKTISLISEEAKWEKEGAQDYLMKKGKNAKPNVIENGHKGTRNKSTCILRDTMNAYDFRF